MAEKDPTATQPTPPEESGMVVNPLLSDAAKAHATELHKDWTQYRARVDIPDPFGGAVLAYRAGDPVPASNVKRWQYGNDLVVKTSAKDHDAVVQQTAPNTPATFRAPGD
jgi:hypothetical protein